VKFSQFVKGYSLRTSNIDFRAYGSYKAKKSVRIRSHRDGMNWSKRRVLVTGGAGFIGTNLVDRLLGMGATVSVVDKIFSGDNPAVAQGKLARLAEIYSRHGFDEIPLHCLDLSTSRDSFKVLAEDADVVFHLAAVFGGREFVDVHQSECARMLAIDHNVISACSEAGVERVHYASSACVYPPSLNTPRYLLKEEDILSTGEGWRTSDNLYGFAKLMGEMQLKAFHDEHDLKSSVSRYLTVYGPGELDASHAIAALIEKALDKMDPYVVWGSGSQERGFTYVEDIVTGTIMVSESITDGSPVNLGWDKRYKIRDVADLILRSSGHIPKSTEFDRTKPEGPFSRALRIENAKAIGWEPKVDLEEGLRRTIAWHRQTRIEVGKPESLPPIDLHLGRA
jgi:nucleoside-diphosphate-sugar epimerase